MVVSSARYPILVRYVVALFFSRDIVVESNCVFHSIYVCSTVGIKGKPNGKDTYKLNSKFRSKLYKIRIGNCFFLRLCVVLNNSLSSIYYMYVCV